MGGYIFLKYLIIQIGGKGLKLANLKSNEKRIIIENTALYRYRDTYIKNGRIDVENLSAFLLDCINSGGFSKNKAVVVISDKFSIIKEFTHPKAKQKTLNSLAKFEAENILNLRVDDYIIQSYTYGNKPDGDNQYRSVMYAVKKDFIVDLKGIFKNTKIKVIKIIPSIYAFVNMIKAMLNLTPVYKGKTVAAVNLGSNSTNLVLFSNNIQIYQYTFASVAHDIDIYISKYLNISIEEARRYSFRNGLKETDENKKNKELYEGIKRISKSVIDELLRAIRLILSAERLELNSIVLTGGFSLIPGIAEHITEITGIDCRKIDELSVYLSAFLSIDKAASNKIKTFSRGSGIIGATLSSDQHSINLLKRAK